MNSLALAAAVFIIDGDIDVAHFAKAKPVKRAVQAYLKTAPKGLKTFLAETGFRPLRDLNRIQIRMKQPINEDQPGEPWFCFMMSLRACEVVRNRNHAFD